MLIEKNDNAPSREWEKKENNMDVCIKIIKQSFERRGEKKRKDWLIWLRGVRHIIIIIIDILI